MIFEAEHFSQFEYCPRYPSIFRNFEPPQWPIREAIKQFMAMGIRGIMAGEAPELTVERLLASGASPGFTYPQGEPYIVVQDHACWLEGVLRLIQEECGMLDQLPVYPIGNGENHVHIEGWRGEGGVHIFRASANFESPEDRTVQWPELCALALSGDEVFVHVFRLPSLRNGRILSPLVMAYQHPAIDNIRYRIARLYDEPEFGKNWKKIARWEIQPSVSWEEWRIGIERDKALPQIREVYSVSPILDEYERKRLIYDIDKMCSAMEMSNTYPRFREACQRCVFQGLCHGDQESRSQYRVANPDEFKILEAKIRERL